jgi:hypothetical protein
VAESGQAVQRITELMSGVSREASASGKQAGTLRGHADAVAEDVLALRSALVHTVRTATTEADRRLETRVPVDVHCSVNLDGATGANAARMVDVSLHGAAINLDVGNGASVGQLGSLVLTHAGNARARFEVRATQPSGRVSVRFVDAGTEPAFEAAIKRMVDLPATTRQAG